MRKGQHKHTYLDSQLAVLSAPLAIYFRRSDHLSARDRADLEAYAEVLRPYYGIPDGEPVFPEQEAEPGRHTKGHSGSNDQLPIKKAKPRATGINGDSHPWRNTL